MRYSSKHQSGLTLVEIMVAITISLILLGGVIQIFASTKHSYNVQQAMSRIQENARLSMDLIQREISASGYMGCLNSVGKVVNVVQTYEITQDEDGNNIKTSTGNPAFDFRLAIQGEQDGDGYDRLVLRRASHASAIPLAAPMTSQDGTIILDTTSANYASLQQWDIVVVSDCANAAVFMITNDPDETGIIQHEANTSPTEGVKQNVENKTKDLNRIFGSGAASLAHIYRVGSTVLSIDDSKADPSRKSLFLELNGQSPQEFIEGIENFKVEYGVAVNANTVRVNNYVAYADGINWSQVLSVRISFDLNSIDHVVGLGESGDGLLRKHFSTTLRLRNHMP